MPDPFPAERLYDRHANSVYGYGFLLTRHPADARKVLRQVFKLAAGAEPFPKDDLQARAMLLSLVRPIAKEMRKRHLHLWRRVAKRALSSKVPPELVETLKNLSEEEAERKVLQSIEGLDPDHLDDSDLCAAPGAGGWRPPPRSMRPMVVMESLDVADPRRRRRRRWVILGILLLSLGLAALSEAFSPAMPRVSREERP